MSKLYSAPEAQDAQRTHLMITRQLKRKVDADSQSTTAKRVKKQSGGSSHISTKVSKMCSSPEAQVALRTHVMITRQLKRKVDDDSHSTTAKRVKKQCDCSSHMVKTRSKALQKKMESQLNAAAESSGSSNIDNHGETLSSSSSDGQKRGVKLRLIDNTKAKDNQTKNLLDALVNVYANQFPLIKRYYIRKKMYAKDHKVLVLLKGNQPIGGICFCPFRGEGFVEVVLCAVTTSEQKKGYGKILMDRLKKDNTKSGIHHFLAYADLDAVGYFAKQGFTKNISLPRNVYKDLIREYDNATLMHWVYDDKISV